MGNDGSATEPVGLPASELKKLVDVEGTAATPNGLLPVFVVSFDNQTDWSLVAAKISITKLSSRETREYIGTPYALPKGQTESIAPKGPGIFVFQIGTFLHGEEQLKPGSKTDKKFVFEPHRWELLSVAGNK